jgi:1-acyl-sn-glycerol-3-phosphate acyltransferase
MIAAHLQKSPDFLPAHPSPLAAFVAGVLLPMALKQRQVSRVEIADADITRLQSLKDERVVLTPNHPTNTDPALVFALSRRAGIPFHYLCCREAFDGWNGWWGFFIQRLGAYSVVRGTVDRESFRYTRQILSQPKSKLVIFPEGEVYSQNDSLLPFQVGAVQLALWGREEARKTEPNAQVLLLPIALRYRFESDVTGELSFKLSRLEKKLKLPHQPNADLYARMRQVAVAVLSGVEREYSLPESSNDATAGLTPRFMAAKNAALTRAANLLEVGELPKGSTPEQMRVLLHRAEQELHAPEDGSTPGAISEQRRARFQLAWRDLERLANWIAIYDGYAAQNPSLERIAEVIFRLENDVLGKATHAGNRIATVKAGEPLSLPENGSRAEMTEWTQKLETAVAQLL